MQTEDQHMWLDDRMATGGVNKLCPYEMKLIKRKRFECKVGC